MKKCKWLIMTFNNIKMIEIKGKNLKIIERSKCNSIMLKNSKIKIT